MVVFSVVSDSGQRLDVFDMHLRVSSESFVGDTSVANKFRVSEVEEVFLKVFTLRQGGVDHVMAG